MYVRDFQRFTNTAPINILFLDLYQRTIVWRQNLRIPR